MLRLTIVVSNTNKGILKGDAVVLETKEANDTYGTSAVLSGRLTMSLTVKAMSYRILIEVIRRPARYRRRF